MHRSLAAILARPIAHRGLHDRAIGRVENSFEAAEAALAAGFGIECDVQLSADGEAIVLHDATLDRLTDARGAIASFSTQRLSEMTLRGGGTIPTLPALLTRIAGRVPLVVEIKGDEDRALQLATRVVDLTRAYGGSVALKSFDPAVARRCRELATPCPVGLVGPEEHAHDHRPADFLDFLSWQVDALPALRAREPGIPLMSWTIRSASDAARAQRHGAQIVFEDYRPDGPSSR